MIRLQRLKAHWRGRLSGSNNLNLPQTYLSCDFRRFEDWCTILKLELFLLKSCDPWLPKLHSPENQIIAHMNPAYEIRLWKKAEHRFHLWVCFIHFNHFKSDFYLFILINCRRRCEISGTQYFGKCNSSTYSVLKSHNATQSFVSSPE